MIKMMEIIQKKVQKKECIEQLIGYFNMYKFHFVVFYFFLKYLLSSSGKNSSSSCSDSPYSSYDLQPSFSFSCSIQNFPPYVIR